MTSVRKFYSNSCPHPGFCGASCTQIPAVPSWTPKTINAAIRATTERAVATPSSLPAASSSSAVRIVAACDGAATAPIGWVCCSCTVALGSGWLETPAEPPVSAAVPGPVAPGTLSLTVGAGAAGLVTEPPVSITVGAGAGGFVVPGPDVLSGMVGAGAGGFDSLGAGGLTGAVGALLSCGVAFRVTRTVSLRSGTAEVFFMGLGSFSSLIDFARLLG